MGKWGVTINVLNQYHCSTARVPNHLKKNWCFMGAYSTRTVRVPVPGTGTFSKMQYPCFRGSNT